MVIVAGHHVSLSAQVIVLASGLHTPDFLSLILRLLFVDSKYFSVIRVVWSARVFFFLDNNFDKLHIQDHDKFSLCRILCHNKSSEDVVCSIEVLGKQLLSLPQFLEHFCH